MPEDTHTPVDRIVRFHHGGSTGNRSVQKYGKSPWGVRRYTPYQRTPVSRILKGANRLARTRPDEANLDQLAELTNKSWRVYKVTPLYGYIPKSQDLRRYSRLLSAHIQAESQKGVVGVDQEVANLAVVSLFKGLRISQDDPEAVSIILKSKPKSGQGEAKVVLSALLCSVGPDGFAQARMHPSFTLLPVLLVKGPVGLGQHLMQWLQTKFDCCTSPLHFPSATLGWMVAMWAGSVTERRPKPVQLTYGVPKEVEGLTRITMTISPSDCKDLWDCIHDSNSNSFSEHEVTCFVRGLESHFYHHFRLDLAAMKLSQVGTATAFVGADGRIKFFSAAHIQKVLGYITDLATERVLTV